VANSQIERFHSAQQQVSRVRVQRRPGDLSEMKYLRHKFRAATNYAAQCVRVTAEKFAGAVYDEISAEFERQLINRSGKRVVHDNDCANGMGGSCQPFQIKHFERRIGRGFEINNTATLAISVSITL